MESPGRFSFAEFAVKFPLVTPSITLGEDTHHSFSVENGPFSAGMVEQFIVPTNGTQIDDEYTEYLPCLSLDGVEDCIALIWWRAGLLEYEYVLATFNPKGELIDRRVIAFTRVLDGQVQRAVAVIDEDLGILVAEGAASASNDQFDPTASRTQALEIMPGGRIVLAFADGEPAPRG